MSNFDVTAVSKTIAERLTDRLVASLTTEHAEPIIAAVLNEAVGEQSAEVGTWQWALEEMKAGKRVKRSYHRGYFRISDAEPESIYYHGEFGGHYNARFFTSDFGAADWQLAKEML